MVAAHEVWDAFWETESFDADLVMLQRVANSIIWERIGKLIERRFGSFEGLEVLEIGSGVGIYSSLMAGRGAKVTLLDYSEAALKRARAYYKRRGLKARFVKEDALSLPSSLKGRYDVSMSYGLAEHFHKQDRMKIIKSHLDTLKESGFTIVSVPNKINFPYRLFKLVAERTGMWRIGHEVPYSRSELERICQHLKIQDYGFFGDSLLSSLDFLNPFSLVRKAFRPQKEKSSHRRRRERGTFLDQYLAYALVLHASRTPRSEG